MYISKPVYTALIVIMMFCIVSSCEKKNNLEKQPSADFNFDKTEYTEGETINLLNISSNAHSFLWTMPDGQTSKIANISYPIERLSYDREIKFKLEAFSKSGQKSDNIVKSVPVKVENGQLVIYDGYFSGPVAISIDGVSYGTAVLPLDIPFCGQTGYSTYTLKAGNHFLQAKGGPYKEEIQSFQIKANECTILRVAF